MEIILFMSLLLIGSIILILSVKGKSAKRKFILIGSTLMVTSPFVAFGVGISYGIWVGSGFASLIMIYIFPALLLTGLLVWLMGIFDKKTNDKTEKSS